MTWNSIRPNEYFVFLGKVKKYVKVYMFRPISSIRHSLDLTYFLQRYWNSLLLGLIAKRKSALISTLHCAFTVPLGTHVRWPEAAYDDKLAQGLYAWLVGESNPRPLALWLNTLTIGPRACSTYVPVLLKASGTLSPTICAKVWDLCVSPLIT
jgi:hypothetical protein